MGNTHDASLRTSHRRRLTGTVVSDAMEKTVVVEVHRTKVHPRYGKRYMVSAKLKAHDERSGFHVGDHVVVEETRPLSREKRWRVVRKLEDGGRKV